MRCIGRPRLAANDQNGTNLDEDTFTARLCTVFLETLASDAKALQARASAPESAAAETEGFVAGGVFMGRAKYQIAMIICERCDQGWQEGAGARIAVDAATVARARCDAQYIGSLEGDGPERAYQDIPPATFRFVWRRDGGRCQTPGCRSARGLEIHHIVARSEGGSNDPRNLTLRCDLCHVGHHQGRITISGTAPDQLRLDRHHEPVQRGAHVGATTSASVTRDTAVTTSDVSIERSAGATDACGEHGAHVGATTSFSDPRGSGDDQPSTERLRRDRHAHAGTRCARRTGLEAAPCKSGGPGRVRGDR